MDADRHLTPMSLALLRAGKLEPAAIAKVIPHLLSHCSVCAAANRRLRSLVRAVGHWDEVIAVSEALTAPALLRRLEALSYPEQTQAIEDDERYHTWGLSRRLLRLSQAACQDSPEAASQLANLALRISWHLGEAYHSAWVHDLRATGFAYLGNARRALGELRGAYDAFLAAHTEQAAGTGDPTVEAEMLDLEARLCCEERRLAAAVTLLDRVLALYAGWKPDSPDATEPLGRVDALALKAWCLYHSGETAAARPVLEEAESRVDARLQADLALAVHSGLLWSAIANRDFADAKRRLVVALDLAQRLGDQANSLRLVRVQARVDQGLGERTTAKEALRQAAEELAERRLGFDAALAWLDLAWLHLLAGDGATALQIAEDDIERTFLSEELGVQQHHHFALFIRDVAEGRLTADLVAAFGLSLEQSRRPSLDWWSAWGAVVKEQDSRHADLLDAG